MLSNIGMPTLLLIIVVALLLFGPSKLPELGRAFGKTLREFKNGAREIMSDEEQRERKEMSHVEAHTSSNNSSPRDDQNLPD